MRPLITLLLVSTLIGGMWAYIQFKESVVRAPAVIKVAFAVQPTKLVIYRTAPIFTDGFGDPALKVSIKDKVVKTIDRDVVPASEILKIEIPDVEIGKNSVYVAANFSNPDAFLDDEPAPSLYALEVMVVHGRTTLIRKTFTSSDAFVLAADVLFEVPPQTRGESADTSTGNHHDHDHHEDVSEAGK